MKLNVSLSAKVSTMAYLDKEAKKWLAYGQKHYRTRTGGTWIKVEFPRPEFSLKVLKFKSESGAFGYVAYLMENATKLFVGVFNLEPWHEPDEAVYKFYHPTAYLQEQHRGKGLFKLIYKWALDKGLNLHTEIEQTKDSHGMWTKLASEYTVICLPVAEAKKSKHTLSDLMGTKFLSTPYYTSIMFSNRMPKALIREYVKKEMKK